MFIYFITHLSYYHNTWSTKLHTHMYVSSHNVCNDLSSNLEMVKIILGKVDSCPKVIKTNGPDVTHALLPYTPQVSKTFYNYNFNIY